MYIEYIPGDLVSVYVGVKKYIVEVIGTENENEALLYQIKFPNGEIQYADKDNIVPIPLTSEILEKNGWKKDGIYFTNRRIPRIKLCTDEREGKWAVIINNDIMGGYIYYVHRLQHILYAFWIEGEMEV